MYQALVFGMCFDDPPFDPFLLDLGSLIGFFFPEFFFCFLLDCPHFLGDTVVRLMLFFFFHIS